MSNDTPPMISARTRSVIYIASLIVNVLAFAALSTLALLGTIEQAVATGLLGIVVAAIGMISNGLAVGYRPTANPTVADGAAIAVEPDDVAH